ncbi:mechanosensitive ion channel family protein [Paracoccus sp. Z118]|nr:mechanosensitive ion channel family protein [Paracoccus sp. Z118]
MIPSRTKRLTAFLTFIGLSLLAVFATPLIALLPAGLGLAGLSGALQRGIVSLALFSGAHLLYLLALNRLVERPKGKHRVPKVALDLLWAALFALATLISLSLMFRQDLSGILTGSGLVLAMLGFAVRNVVADVFSGLALGFEAPFRIGDWVRIETLAQGRVQEIGWRTTRLITRDSTYVILPNSQISRQRITNFSAPRQEYRDHVELTLPGDLPVGDARAMIDEALAPSRAMMTGRAPEVQVFRYGPAGITYRVKYWVPRHDRELACRTEIFGRVDAAVRKKGIRLTPEPATLHPPYAATDPETGAAA